MAATITSQTILDGERNLVVKTHLVGDDSGEITNSMMVNMSEYSGSPTDLKIMHINSSLTGFSVHLHWGADTNVDIYNLPTGEQDLDFTKAGGLVNNAGSGKTGDILFSTVGIALNEEGTITLTMKKRTKTVY